MSLIEVDGNLFESKESLAHCVSQDLHMGAGIAVTFKQSFGRVDKLIEQGKKIGDVAYIEDKGRFIFYLVTKKRYYDKPTYDSLSSCLEKMGKLCQKKGITKLSIPRLGCGLDRLSWTKVYQMVKEVVEKYNLEVTVYNYN